LRASPVSKHDSTLDLVRLSPLAHLSLYETDSSFTYAAALSVIALFDSLVLIFLAAFLLAVPVIYDRYDRLKHLARALRIIRVAAICNGIGIFFSLITA
jgi:hypothetical protein